MTVAELVGLECEVLHYTDTMSHDEFSLVRQAVRGLGASQAAAAVGLGRWDSPYSLWAELTGETPPREMNPQMEAGLRLEPVIIQWAAEREKLTTTAADVILRSTRFPWMICTPDRWVLENGELVAGLEAKNTSWFLEKEWQDGEVPARVQIQALHSMIVTGLRKWHVAALINGWDLRTHVIEFDDVMADNLVTLEKRFWDLVESRTEPPVDGTRATTDALSLRFNEPDPELTLQLSSSSDEGIDFALWCNEKNRLDAQMASLKELQDTAKNRIRNALGDCEVALIDGIRRATWKPRKDGVRVLSVDKEEML